MFNPNNAFSEHLTSLGHIGQFNDQQMLFLKGEGLTGQLNDMWRKYFAANGGTGDFNTDMKTHIDSSINTPANTSALHWRVLGTEAGSFTGGQIAEIEMRETVGGADVITGGTITVGSTFSGTTTAVMAHNGNVADGWAGVTGAVAAGTSWWAYEFATPKTIIEMSIQAKSANGNQVAVGMDFQSSDDGIVWVTEWSVSGQAQYVNSEIREFAK